jgi:hypothetical protein
MEAKRDLLWRQQRPTMPAKQTYFGGKRDLLWKPSLHIPVTMYTQMEYACGLVSRRYFGTLVVAYPR